MSKWIVVVLCIVFSPFNHASDNLSFFSEDKLTKMFVLKSEQGDCPGNELDGDFSKFKSISKDQCASYCGLNKDCLGFSYSESQECILKSINDCKTRTAGTVKFYSKKI